MNDQGKHETLKSVPLSVANPSLVIRTSAKKASRKTYDWLRMVEHFPNRGRAQKASRPKPFSIFNRGQKCLDHFRIDIVSVELIQFRQPEIIAAIIARCFGRIGRVTAQVTIVFHQHERSIEFLLHECRILGHTPQYARPSRDL